MLTTLTALAAWATAQTVQPTIDFSGVQEDLGSEPYQVLVLGTHHLNQLPEGSFEPEHLSLVLDRLEAFEPDIIAIETIGGRGCDELQRYSELYGELAEQYCWDPAPALDALNMTHPQAYMAARQRVAELGEAPTASERRQMALLFFGAGEPWSATVQWAHLDPAERIAADGVPEALVERFDRFLNYRNENNTIGVALAQRLNLQSLASMDDHSADSIYAFAPETLGPTIQQVWSSQSAEVIEMRETTMQYLGSPEALLDGYRYMNSAEAQALTIRADFGKAAATPDHDGVARQYVAWWQTRGLRMAGNVVEAAGNQPGARVLVIVGSSHKAYFEAYLDQMHDWELVSVEDALE